MTVLTKGSADHAVDDPEQRVVVGAGDNVWIWTPDGWDLTHPADPSSTLPGNGIQLDCELANIKIDPTKTALVIIDMQNCMLDKALNPAAAPAVYEAQDAILRYAVPAARKLGLQIIWLNWGLTEEDLTSMPPGEVRLCAFKIIKHKKDFGFGDRIGNPNDPANFIKCHESPNLAKLPGTDLGEIVSEDGSRVNAGRSMMRDTWNTALPAPLADAYEEGKKANRPDVLIYKNRKSGLWNPETDLGQYLKGQNIRTLLFSGINTDQCVGSTLQDAHAQGFDAIMLKDGCGTSTLPYTKAVYEYNCARCWGFLTSCQALAKAADLQ